MDAQPLFAPGILINGEPTNMLLVVTSAATLYALNAGDSSAAALYTIATGMTQD